MDEVQSLFERYKKQAKELACQETIELNKALIELENRMVDAPDLQEGGRMKLRAFIHEYRLQMMDGYEAGVNS